VVFGEVLITYKLFLILIKKIQDKLSRDANLKELLSGSAITFVIKVTGMLIGYIAVLLVSRMYGAEGTGVYSLTTTVLNSLAILGGLGLNTAVLRYVGQFNKLENGMANLKELFKYICQLAFPFSIIVGILLFFLSEEVAVNVFDNPTYIPALKVGAVALPFFTLNLINVEFIRGLKLLKVSEYLRSINRQLVVVIILSFSILSYGILDAVYAAVLGIILSFILSLIFILNYFKKLKYDNTKKPDLTRKELLRTSIPMMTTAVASFVIANAGSFFLEMYSTTNEVGVFTVCLRLAQLVSLVLIVVNTISAPKFAELYWGGKRRELQKFIHQTSKLIFFISLIISVTLIVFSNFALSLFGEEFVDGSLALVILIVGQLINAMTGSVGILLNMTGNQKVFKNIISITTLLLIGSYIIIVPSYGLLGASIVNLFGVVVLNFSLATYVYKKLRFQTFYIPFIS
tara:strand:- start:14678 stop:16054 length:1377 start_codon:yes stop_codon:yes gene_type:complete